VGHRARHLVVDLRGLLRDPLSVRPAGSSGGACAPLVTSIHRARVTVPAVRVTSGYGGTTFLKCMPGHAQGTGLGYDRAATLWRRVCDIPTRPGSSVSSFSWLPALTGKLKLDRFPKSSALNPNSSW
jgi:hypothetical protein